MICHLCNQRLVIFERVWQFNLIDLIFFNWFFLLILSFNIVFDWELGFMTYYALLFIRLFQSHDLKMMLNRLTRVDLTYFCIIFLIKFFKNFIVQHWVWQGWLEIELYELFWFVLYEIISVSWPDSRMW
jgi:hypothetical protein